MDVKKKHFSEDLFKVRSTTLCAKGFQTTKKLHVLEKGRIPNKLGTTLNYALQSDWESTSKNSKGQCNIDIGNSRLASSRMVPKVTRIEHSKTSSTPNSPESINKPKRGALSTITKPILQASDMESFRKKLSLEGISGKAANQSPRQEEMEQILITNRPGESLVIGVTKDKLIPLDVI